MYVYNYQICVGNCFHYLQNNYNNLSLSPDIPSAKPRLAELISLHTPKGKRVKIIESVAPVWRKVGAQLDFDPVGNRLRIIAESERDRPEECCQAMFQYWLDGNGVSSTWSTLIGVLEDCDLNVVALEVKRALQIATGVGLCSYNVIIIHYTPLYTGSI